MSVAIVIPVFNRFEHLPRLLDQLAQQDLPPALVVIVDHGTQTLSLNGSWPFETEILRCSSDLWFTAATNAGLAHARLSDPTFLAILNDDVVLGSDDWLSQLAKLASAPNTIVASTAVDESLGVLYGGIRLRAAAFSYRYDDRGRHYSEIEKSPTNCDVLPTRGIVFSTSILDRIGSLDEVALPHYASDYEWTARAKQQGIRLQMARCVFLITQKPTHVLDASVAKRLSEELRDFFHSRHLKGSLPIARAYSSRVFNGPYRSGYLLAHLLRFFAVCSLRHLRRAIRIRGRQEKLARRQASRNIAAP